MEIKQQGAKLECHVSADEAKQISAAAARLLLEDARFPHKQLALADLRIVSRFVDSTEGVPYTIFSIPERGAAVFADMLDDYGPDILDTDACAVAESVSRTFWIESEVVEMRRQMSGGIIIEG